MGPRLRGDDRWLGLHHDVVLLDRDRKRFGRIGPFDQPGAGLGARRILAGAHAGVAPRFARADVELPGMPRTADDLAAPAVAVLAGLARLEETGQAAVAQRAAAVRAAVAEREELAVEVE